MASDSVASIADSAIAAREQVAANATGAAQDQRAAARFASAALFEEALINAVRARFAELRAVSK